MISEREYKILLEIRNNPLFYDENLFDVFQTLMKEKLIICDYIPNTSDVGYFVTVTGQRAIEDYERCLIDEQQKAETLDIAKNSSIKSTFAIIISGIAMLIGLLSFVVSLF